MEVSVETTSNLGRKMNVIVPAEQVDQLVDAKLKELIPKVKIDGFRPGKVPLSVIKRRYAKGIQQEVVTELLQSTLQEALIDNKLVPASSPNIESIKAELGEPLEYVTTFEIYPEIELAGFSKVQADKLIVDITEQDFETVLQNIRKQHIEWDEVDRAIQNEDKLIIDFEGTVDDKPFEDGKAEDAPLILGSKTFIPGFEEGLISLKLGDEKVVELTFPKDYHVADLADKPVKFAVKIKKVMAPKLPELDNAFAEKMGTKEGDIEVFKMEVKEHMQKQLQQSIKNKLKTQLFEQLAEQNSFDIPEQLVEHQIQTIVEQHSQGRKKQVIDPAKVPPELKKTGTKSRQNRFDCC